MGDERKPNDPPLSDLSRDSPPPASPPPDAQAPSFAIPEVLQLDDPREIVLRLSQEDPFEVRARLARRLRERALILPSTRLALMTMARMAIASKSYTGQIRIEDWVEAALDVSIDAMADSQREEERRGLPVPESEDREFYEELADIFGCPLLDARMACVTLNGMSEDHRQAFHAVVVKGMSLRAWADEVGTRPKKIHDLLREVGSEVQTRLVRRHKARRRRRL
jgi:hypothetical protein